MSAVKEIRKQYSLTQTQLAAYLGMSRSMLAMIESGKRDLSTAALKKINSLAMSYEKNAGKGIAASANTISVTELAAIRRQLKKQLATTNYTISRVQLQLGKMRNAYHAHHIQAEGIKQIMAHTANKKKQDDRQPVLRMKLLETNSRLYKYNPIRQELLDIKLQSLHLEAALLEQLLGRKL